jgi:hypothetical protein
MRRLFLILCLTALFLTQGATSYCTDFYSVTIKNNIGIPTATFPPAGVIGYLGETHPQYPGHPASQDLYAQPPDGYVFTRWTGDVPSLVANDAKIKLVMNCNRTVTANFKPIKHITMMTRGYIHSAPLLYDINQDGYKEIIVGDMAGYIYCFDHSGNLLWEYYAGNAFSKSVSPIPEWFNPEAKNNTQLGNITVQSSCAAGDIDGDAVPEIIVGIGGYVDVGSGGFGGTTAGFGPVGQGGILIMNGNGTLKLLIRGWDTFDGLGNPIQDGFSDGFFSSPALFDVDNDGKLEFVIGGTDQNVYAFKSSTEDTSKDKIGKTIRFFHPPGKDGFWVVPLYEKDDDGDGKFNEDPGGDGTPFTFYNSGDDIAGYVGIDDDGDGLIDEGAPGDDDEDSCQQIGYVNWNRVDEDEFEWPFRCVDTVVSSPAIADIDNSGTAKIVIGTDSNGGTPLKTNRKFIPIGGALRVLTTHSEEVGQFPQWIEQSIVASPSLIDIDRDGQMEVFMGTGTYHTTISGEWKGKGLYAFRSDGTPYLTGTSPSGLFAATQNVIIGAPAFGDIDGDGYPEVVSADMSGYLYAWDYSGRLKPGFPMLPLQEHPGDHNIQIKSSPILVDVDGDHLPEIIVTAGWSIVAVKGDGSIVPEFRYMHANFTTGTTSVFASPAAADLDNNGRLDLVWATGVSNDGGPTIINGIVHLWELESYDPTANPWPMFKRTGTRNSAYTLHLENPISDPPIAIVDKGESLLVSVDVYEGLDPLSSVKCQLKVNGSTVTVPLGDDGTQGDAVAGDGRYTGIVPLPSQINSIGNLQFLATSTAGQSTRLKVAAVFSHVNILNLTTKYYNDILDRMPEPGGAEAWTAEIERMVSLGMDVKEGFGAISKFFFNSKEYLLSNKNNTLFVVDLYQVFFNRTPEQWEITYWAGFLEQGLGRNVLLNYFVYGEEFRLYMDGIFGAGAKRPEPNLVNDFYRGFLNRLPDTAGFNFYLGMMRNAQCSGPQQVRDLSSQIALGFLVGAEYALRGRTDAQFVEDLYNGILRRGALPSEINYWLNFLTNHTYNRQQELAFFTSSDEFQLRIQEVINAGCLSP